MFTIGSHLTKNVKKEMISPEEFQNRFGKDAAVKDTTIYESEERELKFTIN